MHGYLVGDFLASLNVEMNIGRNPQRSFSSFSSFSNCQKAYLWQFQVMPNNTHHRVKTVEVVLPLVPSNMLVGKGS